MDIIAIIAIVTAFILSVNVGGNNSATEMGPAFGAGVRTKHEAVILIAIFSMIGAVVAGDKVVNTIGSNIIPGNHLQTHFVAVIIILLSATAIIAFANVLKLPIATSHAMVGAVVGIGVFYQSVAWYKVAVIVIWWLVTPFLSLFLSYLIGRYLYDAMALWVKNLPGQGVVKFMFRGFITLSGCYIAFSAGSNSLAKAVGPVVGAGILTTNHAAILGGMGMAVGALIVGHRLLHTVGMGITPIDPLKATLVELICGTILLIASHYGIPISLAETITCSVIGFGAAHGGIRNTLDNQHVKRIYKLWPACPFVTAITSYVLISILHFSGVCTLK